MSGMKRKIINKIIRGKMIKWLKTIDDKQLSKDLEKNIIVSGGCITSMLLGEDVNDFDVYFKTKEISKRVAEYYVEKFSPKQKGVESKVSVVDKDDHIEIEIKSSGIISKSGEEKEYKYFEFDGDLSSVTEDFVEDTFDFDENVEILKNSKNKNIDSAYISEIIDRIF